MKLGNLALTNPQKALRYGPLPERKRLSPFPDTLRERQVATSGPFAPGMLGAPWVKSRSEWPSGWSKARFSDLALVLNDPHIEPQKEASLVPPRSDFLAEVDFGIRCCNDWTISSSWARRG